VYATVKDKDGRLVPDLGRDAFAVDDNGKRQELTLFANDLQPITVVLLLDRSTSMRSNFRLVQKAADQFVDDLLPADKARIGSFSNRIQLDPQDFTSDHDQLHDILRNQLQEEGPTPLWNAVNVGITGLLHQQGRKVILVFTDGADAPGNFSSPNNSSLKDVMKRADEEDVMVYAIGLAGGSGRGGYYRMGPGGGGFPGGHRRGNELIEGVGFQRGFGGGFAGGMGRGGMGRGRPSFSNTPDEGLAKLAAATGGGYFELQSTDDLVATFNRVVDELHHQYALGFTPAKLDGKMHNLDVHVTGEGRTVRARKRYLAKAL
jgi:VWFA-related protein